jgi:hypothetical protein
MFQVQSSCLQSEIQVANVGDSRAVCIDGSGGFAELGIFPDLKWWFNDMV